VPECVDGTRPPIGSTTTTTEGTTEGEETTTEDYTTVTEGTTTPTPGVCPPTGVLKIPHEGDFFPPKNVNEKFVLSAPCL